MAKILIIGAASGLGASFAASVLQNSQHTLVTVDDLRVEKDLRNLQFALSHKKGDRHKFHLTSMCDAHISDKIFELERPNWVVFCKTPEKNTYHQSLVKVLCSAKKYNAKVLYVAPDSWSADRNESYHYGVEVCRSDSNIEMTTILHACRIFGPRQEVGDIMTDTISRILSGIWPNTAAASNRPREWLYVKDIISAIETIIASSLSGGEFCAASRHRASESEIMMCLQKISEGRRFEFSTYDTPLMDCSRLTALGWTPKHQVYDALEHTLAWYSINPWAIDTVRND